MASTIQFQCQAKLKLPTSVRWHPNPRQQCRCTQVSMFHERAEVKSTRECDTMQASFPSVGAAISRRQTTHPRPVTAQPRPVLRGACSRGGNRSSGPVWERLGATAEHAPNRPSSAFARPATGFAQPLASGQSLKRLTDELSTKLVRLLPLLSRLLPLLSRAFYCALPRALLRMIPFSPSHDSSHDSSRTFQSAHSF